MNTVAMQGMIGGGSSVGIPQLDEQLTQLGSGEARPDDRAMKSGRDVPDLGPSAFCVGQDERPRIISHAERQRGHRTSLVSVNNGKV
jgi:hypothetical protein